MTGSDTLHLEILGGVTCQLENLCKDGKRTEKRRSVFRFYLDDAELERYLKLTSSEVLEDGSRVDSGGSTNTTVGGRAALQETMDTTDRELETCRRETNDKIGGG